MRLDNYLVENKMARSRNKAQEFIKKGLVKLNGVSLTKPSYLLKFEDVVEMEEHQNYLSRAAYKLSSFLELLDLGLKGVKALDIGSSTGGFTEVLLEHGVLDVSAVDVGTAQLHPSLLKDPRVFSFENCDIRDFKSEEPFDIVVSDLSFISLLHIIDVVDTLAKKDIILLFKPQFEVGREAKRDKNGVVQDTKAITKAMENFEDKTKFLGWKLIKKEPAYITGKDGNLEYCYYFRK